MPQMGKADYDILYVEYGIKAKRIKPTSRKIYPYKRADMVGLKDHMTHSKDAYLSEDRSHMSFQKSLPKQLRYLIFFAGTWLLHELGLCT